jgi:tetratricopeptide (TPR) repeat protein
MDELIQPDGERGREFIKNLIDSSSTRSLRGLAKKAGIQPSIISRFLKGGALEVGSAIKLYMALPDDIDVVKRRTFLQVMGLSQLVSQLSPDLLPSGELQSRNPIASGNPTEVGTHLMALGYQLAPNSWEKAIPLFREAENAFGVASSQAARAALEAAQALVNLCDYDKAQAELLRIENTYRSIIDPETEAEWYRINGWLDYYQGDFAQAEKWLLSTVEIAKRTGVDRLADFHFLGRLYCDWGQVRRQQQEASSLFHKAEVFFDTAYKLQHKEGPDVSRAFDLFRKAQLLQAQHNRQKAQKLRTMARQMFDRDLAVLHVDLEEARLDLEDGETRKPKLRAEKALKGWAQIKYAKGMSDALRVLGVSEWIHGKPAQALELYAAALCIYPFENHLGNQKLWVSIVDLYSEIICKEGRKAYRSLMRRIQEFAEGQQGYFSYLANVSADRSADIARVLIRLRNL